MVDVRLVILSNLAKAEPPLGPILGQHGLNAREVVKNINNETRKYCDGIPVRIRIRLTKDKKGEVLLDGICASDLLMEIAGNSGYVTRLELANIAKVQSLELGISVFSSYKSLLSTLKSMKLVLR